MRSTIQETANRLTETGSGCYTCSYSFTTSMGEMSKSSTVTNQQEYICSVGSKLSSFNFPSDILELREVTISSGAEKILKDKNFSSEKISELLGGISNLLLNQTKQYVISLSKKKDDERVLIKIILPTAKIGQKIQLLEDCNDLIFNIADQFENKSDKINFQSSFFVEITETKNGFTI